MSLETPLQGSTKLNLPNQIVKRNFDMQGF